MRKNNLIAIVVAILVLAGSTSIIAAQQVWGGSNHVAWTILFWVTLLLSAAAAVWLIREVFWVKDEKDKGSAPLWRIGKVAGKLSFEDHTYNGDRPYLDADEVGELESKKIKITKDLPQKE